MVFHSHIKKPSLTMLGSTKWILALFIYGTIDVSGRPTSLKKPGNEPGNIMVLFRSAQPIVSS